MYDEDAESENPANESHYSQPFSVDFLEIFLKRRRLKNLKKSANKFIKNKKFNITMKKKKMIFYEKISNEKYMFLNF